ncbi:beta-2-microglobulin-like [Astyanax mexicanus]|uniref:beta-2-microglobulin-like n=1 Tax=Astyanax mexicanus TaxID=7994 RepID=UPI0020CAE02C|nr:beta-2-microglobulin-like [Astyanax mexicanus]
MEYGKETLRKHSPPKVYAFAKKSVRDSRKLTLTCLATGFYHKDVVMSVRKFGTSFPEHLITSSAVRPNDDGTYQLRKSVEIQEDDSADFHCYVSHSSLKEPIIVQWDKTNNIKSKNDAGSVTAGIIAGVLLIISIIIIGVCFLKKIISGEKVLFSCPTKKSLPGNGESNRAT